MTTSPDDGIPPLEGLDDFLRAFDAAVVEPPRARTCASLVLIAQEGAGTEALRIVRALRERCIDSEDRPLAPVALCPPRGQRPTTGQVQFYESIVDGLRTTKPGDIGRLTFRDYALMRTVVEASLTGRGADGKAKELRKQLHRARFPARPGGPPPLDEVLPWFGKLLLWTWGRAVQPLFSWRTDRRMMRGWFGPWAQVALRAKQESFFQSAHQLSRQGQLHTPEHIDAVLTRALLADLDRALRRRWWSPWRRRRTARCVLLLAEPDGDSGQVRGFLAAYTKAVRQCPTTGTVLVARTRAGTPDELGVRVDDSFTAVAASLADKTHETHEAGATGPLRAGAVRVGTGQPGADAVADWLKDHPKIPDREGPSRSPRAAAVVQSVAMVAVLTLLYSGAGFLGAPLPLFEDANRPCPEGQFEAADGHGCLGLSDGSEPFAGASGEYNELLDMIRETNAEVTELAERGQEIRTIVHFEPFTDGQTFSQLVEAGVLPELRGLALQQREALREARNNDKKVGIRVLLANSGPLFEEGERVAELIVAWMAEERIVGVVGLGQSRLGTKRAIKVLDRASLPMISTSATADEMTEQSPQYYQIAPGNRREARAAVSFVKHQEFVTLPDGSRRRAKSTVVVHDPHDPYSSNLSADFEAEFRKEVGGKVTMVDYSPDSEAVSSSVTDLARRVCGALRAEPATMVFWAGRAREMLAFLDEFRKSPDCDAITVLGGDDLTNSLIKEENPVATYRELTLHHMAHAVPGIDRPTNEVSTFVERYQKQFGADDLIVNDGHPALGWDALKVLSHAVNLARSTSHDPDFDKSTVSSKLRSSDNTIQGVTGVLDFYSAGRSVPIPRDKPIYVIEDARSGPHIALKCGNFGVGAEQTKWGSPKAKYPCPRD
ncbi:hypothetical protein [Streptomyces gobiensis]|uniref:hypothetical protein n=1 Tax=Streptomyces gobiensis TaxID=2875706 RepID=UPI001E514D8A|nr:hypothetical protein [Streptomyces gobiensis]UGY93586.1 hypothetical protein test1122_18920 [Streptomyces gobiensis]